MAISGKTSTGGGKGTTAGFVAPLALDSVPDRRATESFSLTATNSSDEMPLMIYRIPYQKVTLIAERWLALRMPAR